MSDHIYANAASLRPGFHAVLDVGSTCFCYAFATANNPKEVIENKNWARHLGRTEYKAPTVIFRNSTGDKCAIGFSAIEDYQNETENSEAEFPSIVTKFTNGMKSHDKSEREQAVRVFLQFVDICKDHVCKAIYRKFKRKVTPQEVKWSFARSNRWSDNLLQNIEENLRNFHGINVDPDRGWIKCTHAAFLYCMNQPGIETNEIHKALVINAGGTEIQVSQFSFNQSKDVLSYKVEFDKSYPYGSDMINQCFIAFLESVLGEDFITDYKQHSVDWLDFSAKIEIVKQAANPNNAVHFQIPLSATFGEVFLRLKNQSLEDYLRNDPKNQINNGKILEVSRDGKLVIPHRKMDAIYKYVIYKIKKHVFNENDNLDIEQLQKVFLTGGFCQSPYLQETVRTFAGSKLVIPENANLCVAKGCLLQGCEGIIKLLP